MRATTRTRPGPDLHHSRGLCDSTNGRSQSPFLQRKNWTRSRGLVSEYYIHDALGSTVRTTNTAGNTQATYSYDPDGNTTTTTGTSTNPFKYAGGRLTSAGLYHYGQRYYDPADARWTQPDALNQATDLRQANKYPYVGGDPINLVDPTGLFSLDLNVTLGIVEFGVEIDEDLNTRSYYGGGGLGLGLSASASFGPSDDGYTGGGCYYGCVSVNEHGGYSVGAGPKASAGLFYRKYR